MNENPIIKNMKHAELDADVSALYKGMEEAELLLEAAPEEIVEVFFRFFEDGGDILDWNPTTTFGAGKTCLHFQLSDGFSSMLAALRARDWDKFSTW